ncbi:SRPBCC domain-containing protein [Planococcus sp. ISL-110]|uniref:SRPBCC family protein n=1 Tax=Planococcus sp. ISL-110 TaxID=2819167 RepID=UPI001BE879A4|nr:SRPBCC domain-containing protein [Planococcus sp. ISL-110]MBT2571341.1 SRPBCC domain-containing protein [Planococcus sp. ISL-110]
MTTSTVVLSMARRFNASDKAVYEAWTNPELMKKWLFTQEDTNQVAKNVLRAGGSWEIVDRREGVEYRAIGEYLELKPPHKLMFSFKMPQLSDHEDRITVWISMVQKSCEMAFVQEIVVPHEEGWTQEDVKRTGTESSEKSRAGWGLMFENLKKLVEQRVE